MLTSLTVFSSLNEASALPIDERGVAATDPIFIKRIDGLGPVKANINMTSYGLMDGEAFLWSSIGRRNLVLTIGCNPNWEDQSMESLRAVLYEYFMPQLEVRLRFESTHLPTVDIEGYIESLEPTIFSQDPEYQISILCPYPHFTAVDPTVVRGTVWSSLATPTTIRYEGSVPSGFVIRVVSTEENVDFSGTISLVNVVNFRSERQTFHIGSVRINVDEYLEVGTVPGDKYVRSILDNSIVDRLQGISGTAIWPKLVPGRNDFGVLAVEEGQAWELSYYARYGGL